MNEDLLLLIAAYLRKSNHPTETDIDIDKNVRIDLAKIIRARARKTAAHLPPEQAKLHLDAENARAADLEA